MYPFKLDDENTSVLKFRYGVGVKREGATMALFSVPRGGDYLSAVGLNVLYFQIANGPQ